MRICVYGAGAIGGNLASHLIRQVDAEVSVVARGAHLAAIRRHGLVLRGDDEVIVAAPAAATDDPITLGEHDVVFVTAKAHSASAAARDVGRLLGPSGVAVFINNGIPWWWNYRGGPVSDEALPLLDPEGLLWSEVRPDRVIGGVVYSSNEVIEPGVIRHYGMNRWILGEPDGGASARLDEVAGVMSAAGLGAVSTRQVRTDIWEKLLLNLTSAPLATLTRLYSSDLRADPDLHGLQRSVFAECAAIPAAMHIPVTIRYEDTPVPPFQTRPSMLQDVLAGRPIEVEAMLGQPQRFARELDVATPVLDVVLPLLRGLDRAVRGGMG